MKIWLEYLISQWKPSDNKYNSWDKIALVVESIYAFSFCERRKPVSYVWGDVLFLFFFVVSEVLNRTVTVGLQLLNPSFGWLSARWKEENILNPIHASFLYGGLRIFSMKKCIYCFFLIIYAFAKNGVSLGKSRISFKTWQKMRNLSN